MPRSKEGGPQGNNPPDHVHGMSGGQDVEETRVRIAAQIEPAVDEQEPNYQLRGDEHTSEYRGRNQPATSSCGISLFNGSPTELVSDAAGRDQDGADPDLEGQLERTPLESLVRGDNHVGAHQAA